MGIINFREEKICGSVFDIAVKQEYEQQAKGQAYLNSGNKCISEVSKY